MHLFGVNNQSKRAYDPVVSLTTYTPNNDAESRALVHLQKAADWTTDGAGMIFTEFNTTNRAVGSEATDHQNLLNAMMLKMRSMNASWTPWADGVWGANYNVALVNRNTDVNYNVGDTIDAYYSDPVTFRGPNWAELEFGGGPGWFTGPSEAQLQRYEDAGANVLRIPISSVYLHASDGAATLEAGYMSDVADSINAGWNSGLRPIIDIHDYCTYRNTNITTGSAAETNYHDMLDQLLNYTIDDGLGGTVLLKNHASDPILEIMNEPANAASTSAWETVAQDTMDYIRNTIGWNGHVMVAIGAFSGVHSVDTYHPGGPFITDAQNNYSWVFHYYPNSIGQYGSWDGTFHEVPNAANASTQAIFSKEDISDADNAWSGGSGTGWQISSPSASAEYIGWDFTSGGDVSVWQYSIDNNDTDNPTDWVLESSPDNSVWTIRHTVTGESAWNEFGENRSYTLDTVPPTARYWRIRFTGHNGTGIRMGDIKFFGTPMFSREVAAASAFTGQGSFTYIA